MNSKLLLGKNFSRYAESYDKYCAVQNLCARDLIAKIGPKDFSSILDIGCGTGNFTRLLKDKFPNAGIMAIDISRGMLRIAKEKLKMGGIEFLEDDAETVIFDRSFDLISSNATLQWTEDLEKTLASYRGMLRDDGSIWFSIFAQETFCELSTAIREVFGRDAHISTSSFIRRDKIKMIMESHFKNARVQERSYKERYASLRELLDRIRFTGTRGWGAGNGVIWTRKRIDELESVYIKRFGEIRATYQVFFCGGNR